MALPGEVDGGRAARLVRVDQRALHADRTWAVRDIELGAAEQGAVAASVGRLADRLARRDPGGQQDDVAVTASGR